MDKIDDVDKINNMMKYIITLLMKFLLTCTVHVINDYYKYEYCYAQGWEFFFFFKYRTSFYVIILCSRFNMVVVFSVVNITCVIKY